ncbi:MAG: DUF2177 family protein [Woeseiaceae bacterium]
MSFAKAYIGTALPFLVIDAAWIGLVVRGYYQDTIGYLLLDKPNLVAGGLFYLAYAAGIVILAVQPAAVSGKLKTALINGAVLGAMAYGTFTLTNFAVLRGWTTGLVVSDILWGTFLTAISAACGYLFSRSQPATP